eukprot:scaffold12701_cov40-Cyclotella_meneghiniana.AAC.5
MSDNDSSDDDVPLSALAPAAGTKRQSRGGSLGKSVNYNEEDSDEEQEFQDDDEEEAAVDEEDDDEDDFIDDDDDDEDDQPLSALKSPPVKKKLAVKKPPKKKESSAKAKKPKPKSSAKSSSSSAANNSNYKAPSIELYANCDKGKLIQSTLLRWWYAYTWPDPKSLPTSTPANYTALDGFPGVYICTSGSDVGKFKDYRDMTTAPNFKNFAHKPASELQELLLKAIENQRKALRKMEGEGTKTEKDLRELEKWAGKLNCSKVDKEAEKVLKAAKLSLS